MGYRIQYGQTVVREQLNESAEKNKSSSLFKWIATGCILLTLTLLGRIGCLDFLIPGDKIVTKQAFSSMVNQVQDGEDLKTAITAFCLEIINSAETPN